MILTKGSVLPLSSVPSSFKFQVYFVSHFTKKNHIPVIDKIRT